MKMFQSLLGRRQFLVAAGVTSTSALAAGKLAGIVDPVFKTSDATASEKPGTAERKSITINSGRYSHLLSPIKIGNVVIKNRMIHSRSLPHFLQGPETFPSEAVIQHYAGVARNGAAIVTVKGGRMRDRKTLSGDSAHGTIWDTDDPAVQNYYAQMADAIHFYDSMASVGLNLSTPDGYAISNLDVAIPRGLSSIQPGKEIPVKMIQDIIDDAANQAKFYQNLGYDMVNIYMSYRAHILAHALSPALNKRTDKYGGSLENRARFPLELFQAIKKACGQDFLIEAQISGEEVAGGYTVEDVVKYSKLWEGAVDILQLRATTGGAAHPTGFNSKKKAPITLRYAQAIKEGGAKVLTAPIGGYQNLDFNEEFIATGKTDMIAMARSFICEPEYSKKAYEGRGEDVVPCILCNDCHGLYKTGPWVSFCSVNPEIGLAHRLGSLISPPSGSKKVAVIGGGPAGMKAAITAADRGHKVTLYEKNDFLGGQIKYSDYASFKWPLKDFKDYMINQVKKAGVEVLLSTKATPEMIKAKKYDAVLVASGAEPIIPNIPGADGSNVRAPIFVYGNENALGKNVVVIGGKQIGVESGIYLAQNGHKVTVLAEERSLAADANQIHFIEQLREAWEAQENFSFITQARATAISKDKVTYVDAKGAEKSIQADSVVIDAGRKPRQDDAIKFYGTAGQFFIIGDCRAEGRVAHAMRTAFAAASQI
jgi:2,4-dienoyl-CoA reductase-like NADH-dependent reductase (Old Yellow Enzyme family)/thioredoxin reductase